MNHANPSRAPGFAPILPVLLGAATYATTATGRPPLLGEVSTTNQSYGNSPAYAASNIGFRCALPVP